MNKFYLSIFTFISLTSHFAAASEADLQDQVQKLKAQNEVQASQIQQIQAQTNMLMEQKNKSATKDSSDTTLGGYGEINYNNYSNDNSRNQMDLSRFVVFLGHRFDENLSFNGELEFEHAVASKDDNGEAEVEQAYLNYQFSSKLNMKIGLFLMPFGFLNESHEPPVYYGVERNEVETRIIPSTWREGGVAVYGTTDAGFDWSVGLVTGFDIAKFDDAGSPLSSVHQELQQAKAQDLAIYGAVNYRIPGLVVGTALFNGKSVQGDADFNADATKPSFAGINGTVTLGDVHARYQDSGFDVEALYAKGFIGEAGEINTVIQAYNTAHSASRAFVPAEFSGALFQVAYTIPVGIKATLSPFVRYEDYDTQAKMSEGVTADPANKDQVTTAGVSFHPHQQVVFKADYQAHNQNTDNNRFDLGMGYMF